MLPHGGSRLRWAKFSPGGRIEFITDNTVRHLHALKIWQILFTVTVNAKDICLYLSEHQTSITQVSCKVDDLTQKKMAI